jgi:hypothetical protein
MCSLAALTSLPQTLWSWCCTLSTDIEKQNLI